MRQKRLSPFLPNQKNLGTKSISSEDQTIQVIPITAILPQEEQGQQPRQSTTGAQITVSGITADSLYFVTAAVVDTLPHIWKPKLATLPPEMIKSVNEAFTRYCIKKNLNPAEFIFDEAETLLALLPIYAFYQNSYSETYSKDAKEKESGGNAAFDHVKELEKDGDPKNEKELQTGMAT